MKVRDLFELIGIIIMSGTLIGISVCSVTVFTNNFIGVYKELLAHPSVYPIDWTWIWNLHVQWSYWYAYLITFMAFILLLWILTFRICGEDCRGA